MNKTIQTTLRWIISVILLLMASFYFGKQAWLSGILVFVLGVVTMPLAFMQKILKRELLLWQCAVIFFVGFLLSIAVVPEHVKRELEAERLKREVEAKKLAEERAKVEQEERARREQQERAKAEQEKKRDQEKQTAEAKAKKSKPKPKKREEPASEETKPDFPEVDMNKIAHIPVWKRKEVWSEVIIAERRASAEAEKAIMPQWDEMKGTIEQKSGVLSEYMSNLKLKYFDKIYKKYDVTREQCSLIGVQAHEEDWEKPKVYFEGYQGWKKKRINE